MGQYFWYKGRGADPSLVQQRRLSYRWLKLRPQFRRRQRHSDVHLRIRPRVSDESHENNQSSKKHDS